jgi:hypothetical protein
MSLLLTDQYNVKLHVSTRLSHRQAFVLEPYITTEAGRKPNRSKEQRTGYSPSYIKIRPYENIKLLR